MKPCLLSLVSAVCISAGLMQGVSGVWIYAKAGLAQYLLNRAWDRTISGEERAHPWPWADTWPVARLSLADSEPTLIVLSGANGRNLAFAPGHLDGSVAPGEPGSCVIAGHRDTHFPSLEDLEMGDSIILEDRSGTKHTYRVHESAVVHETQTSVLADSVGPTLVLITCWPFGALTTGGELRYVVWADGENSGT